MFSKPELLKDARQQAARYISHYPDANFDKKMATYLAADFAQNQAQQGAAANP